MGLCEVSGEFFPDILYLTPNHKEIKLLELCSIQILCFVIDPRWIELDEAIDSCLRTEDVYVDGSRLVSIEALDMLNISHYILQTPLLYLQMS